MARFGGVELDVDSMPMEHLDPGWSDRPSVGFAKEGRQRSVVGTLLWEDNVSRGWEKR
ncbi:MAG: hypothetical protein HKO65_10085 [Gemmatimonadetes bacterium]|nr:hypothetical protein [Gemmatimonadota bacterium]